MADNAVLPGSGILCERKYPEDPTKEVFEAAKSGDAVLLSEVLQPMDASERAWLLGSLSFGDSSPLLVAAEYGHLDCVKVLLKYKADVGSDDDDGDDVDDDDDDADDVVVVVTGRDDNCIIKASEYGHVNVVSFLVEQGANMDFQDKEGNTPLIKASKNGHTNVVTFLVEQGANMNLQDQNGNTPLMLASINGHMNVVSFLVEHGAKMDLQDKWGYSPLMSAAIRGHMDFVTFCVEHGANVDYQDKEGNTALMLASKNGHMNVVTFLVESGANINLQDKNGKSPLMIHVASDHCSRMNIATFLIEQGAKVNLQDKEGKTALHHAIENNSRRHGDSHRNLEAVFKTVRCLIKNGANVDATTNGNCTPLMIASKEGEVRVIDLLIKHGANVDLQDEEGKTALYHTIDDSRWHGDSHFKVVFQIVRCLIKNGANVNASTNDNCTPLMIASTKHNQKVINLLMKHGASVDLQDEDGRTALHHAIERFSCFRWTSVNTLIKNGANVNATTNDNCTPLMLAIAEGDVRVIELLIKHRANVDLQDKYGRTALFYAVTVDDFYLRDICLETVQCLIKNGANVNTSRDDNCTPLMMATCAVANKFIKLDLLTILIEHGANMDLQDKNGDTALHYAMKRIDEVNSDDFDLNGHDFDPCKVVNTLLTCGAAQLCNNQQLTPLLLASNKGMDFMVENLIKILEYTKKQRVDALELLGATLVACSLEFEEGFEYIKRGMEERFQDSSHPLLKQPMDPIEAYENKKECQTLEELARINGTHAILMESLIIRERILGTGNPELLGPIRHAADFYKHRDSYNHKCIGLYRHAMKIAQQCNQSVTSDLNHITSVLYEKGWWNVPPRQKDFVLELLEQTVFEYENENEKQQKFTNDLRPQSLFTSSIRLVQIVAKFEHLEESKTSHLLVLLQKLFHLNPRDCSGNSLLHKAVEPFLQLGTPRPLYQFPCISTVKLLLNSGINVDAFSSNGDTPLHKAVMYIPSSNNIHYLTSILEALLDGGAHHDFVNNDGKTAMDLAHTDEACRILSEKRKLELKCISARAVKKFGLPYLGVVPKTLEKFISMH